MKQTKLRSWSSRFSGYIAIPHELLHMIGYRLAGQQCEYHWGNSYVTPAGPMTRRGRLVGLLFPFIVFFVLVLVFGVLSGLAYSQALRSGFFFWFILWLTLMHVAGVYAGTTIGDLRKAYLLIFNKPWYGWTPFDIFYWPIVDWSEVRKGVLSRQNGSQI